MPHAETRLTVRRWLASILIKTARGVSARPITSGEHASPNGSRSHQVGFGRLKGRASGWALRARHPPFLGGQQGRGKPRPEPCPPQHFPPPPLSNTPRERASGFVRLR